MHDRSDWTQGPEGPKYIRNRTYAHLVEFSRPCATCGVPFSIYVTRKIAEGHADSNAFALENCEEHRRGGKKEAKENAESKERVMSEEMDGLYQLERELRTEVEKLLARNAELEAQVRQKKMPWES